MPYSAAAVLSRKYGISTTTYYHWKKRYYGLTLEDLKRLKKLEKEHSQLTLDHVALKDIVSKKW